MSEVQESDPIAQKIRAEELQEVWKDIQKILNYWYLPFYNRAIWYQDNQVDSGDVQHKWITMLGHKNKSAS